VLPILLGGRYELLEEIGHGAYAIVYRGHDHVLDRMVAVKLLRDPTLSPDASARFAREVHITATLEHPHILHVHDSGTYDGRPFIVTEFAPDGSLDARLERDGQLGVEEALQITSEVGLALAHAHRSGVVHRDIKPDNILLGRGGALLADFGVAIDDPGSLERLTRTGATVGTVLYMSPEQLCAERNIDGRSDQYALALVLYEMIAGVRPHIAATVEGLRLQRMQAQHLPLRAHRPSVPHHVNDAVQRALASMPADRFRNIGDFMLALGLTGSGEYAARGSSGLPRDASRPEGHSTGAIADDGRPRGTVVRGASGDAPPPATARSRPRRRRVLAAGGVLCTAVLLATVIEPPAPPPEPTPVDGLTIVLAPSPGAASSDTLPARVDGVLRAELTAWNGVRLAPRPLPGDPRTLEVTTSITPAGDSTRVLLHVRHVASGREWDVTRTGLTDTEQSRRALATSLSRELLTAVPPGDARGVEGLSARSLPVLHTFVRAHDWLRRGELDSAAATFRAVAADAPEFAHAHLWAALADAWRNPGDVDVWRGDVRVALASGALHDVDSLLALGLDHMAARNYPDACRIFRQATVQDARSFEAWYSLGECARLDLTVIDEGRAPVFRSSVWGALDAYRQAVETARSPQLLGALFPYIMNTTYAELNRTRTGRSGGASGTTYRALPSLDADTLAFLPAPQTEFERMGPRTVPATYASALRRARDVSLELTERWITRMPDSPEAWYFRAFALELSGYLDASAGEAMSAELALDRAERDGPSPSLRARMATARTRVLLRRGDIAGAAAAARTALRDTLNLTAASRTSLAPLAALLGESRTVLQFSPPMRLSQLPTAMVEPLHRFNHLMWMGECTELQRARAVLESRASAAIAPAERAAWRARWLQPVYRFAAPCLGVDVVAEFDRLLPLDHAYAAIAAGDLAAARRYLREARATRSGASSGGAAWDYLYVESWTWVQAGDTAAAYSQLVAALDDMASMSTFTLDFVPQAAGLRRAMMLLQELERSGVQDEGVTRWATRARALTQRTTQGGGG
jgi:serine/threonine-protein kinase